MTTDENARRPEEGTAGVIDGTATSEYAETSQAANVSGVKR